MYESSVIETSHQLHCMDKTDPGYPLGRRSPQALVVKTLIHAFARPLFPSFYGCLCPYPFRCIADSVAYIRGRPIVEQKNRQNNRKIPTQVNSIYRSIEALHGRFKGRSHRSFSITRDFQATVFSECHGNTDVWFE